MTDDKANVIAPTGFGKSRNNVQPATKEEREQSEQSGFVVKWRPKSDERVVGQCEQQPDGTWRAEARLLTTLCAMLAARRTGLTSEAEGYAWLESLPFRIERQRRRTAKVGA